MKRNIFVLTTVLTGYLSAMGGPVVNYDEEVDKSIQSNVEVTQAPKYVAPPEPTPLPIKDLNPLEGLELEKLYFQQKIINEKNKKVKKYVEVTEILIGSKVTYITKLINHSPKMKKNIIVRNPIPDGAKYVLGSASCLKQCTIRYSSDNGQTFVSNDKGGEEFNYIEFTYRAIPSNKEFRMGFDAIAE